MENKMKQLINEVKRMQRLAGIITESQLNEGIEELSDAAVDLLMDKSKYMTKPGSSKGVLFVYDLSLPKEKDQAPLIGYWYTKDSVYKKNWFTPNPDHQDAVNKLLAESQPQNEGWDDFNANGWMARIEELAKEMGYDVSTGWDDQNTTRAELKAADEVKKGEKKAYIGTVDDGNTIVVTFTLDKDNKDQNKANIQKKIVDLYKNDANVTLGRATYNDTLMQVIIKDKTKSQPQNELFGLGSKIQVPDKADKSKLVKVGTGDLVIYNPQYDNSGYAYKDEGTYVITQVKKDGVILKKADNQYQSYNSDKSRDVSGGFVNPSSLAYFGKK